MDGLVPPKKPGLLAFLVRIARWAILGIFGLAILSVFFEPSGPNMRLAQKSAAMQTSRTIALCMFQYSVDHDDKFPDGASSTEVFQKLIDGNYFTDPAIFYWPMPGKTKPISSHLRPENVSWDVSVLLDKNSDDFVPAVFITGFRIQYKPGGRAVPIPDKPHASFSNQGLAVCYKSISALFLKASPDGSIPIIPADAKIDHGPYRQLTPDGPLSP